MALFSAFPVTNILGTAPSTSTSLNAAVTAVFVSPTSSAATVGNNIVMTTDFRSAVFTLNATQCPPNSSQTLGVWVRHSPDGGNTFDDFVAFATVAPSSSNGTANVTSVQIAQWVRDVAPSSSLGFTVRVPATRALAAGTVIQGPVGALWRAEAIALSSTSSSQAWKVNVTAQVAQ
jgi:hypothetical protein